MVVVELSDEEEKNRNRIDQSAFTPEVDASCPDYD